MNGTVTISLEDFKKLEESSKVSLDLKNKTILAAKELEVFLSFLCTRESITHYIDEFNKQASKSKIILDNGRAKIKFNEEA
jgi:uncharacterized protein related to proFAR isomerase